MSFRNFPPNPICPRAPLPSSQMIIRRYRSIDGQRDLDTFFNEGLFSKRLTEFEDDNEGVVDNFVREGGVAGVLAAQAGMKQRRKDRDIEDPSDEEWIEGLKEYHKDARKQHFANCWRIGTDETKGIWKEYTRDPEMIQGCAIETTIGKFMRSLPEYPLRPDFDSSDIGSLFESPGWNIALNNTNCDMKVGACRYQQRWKDETYQPGGWPATTAFFKGEEFDIENEFRLVVNPYLSNIYLDSDVQGIPQTPTPDTGEKWKKFVAATKWMANKIIMAPNAREPEVKKVRSWLSEFGLEVNDGKNPDINIIHSKFCESQYNTHEYLSELGGNANYPGTDDHLKEICDRFLMKRDWDEWPVVDLVFLLTEEAGGIIEGYWHRNMESAFELSEYGHPFQRVWAVRIVEKDSVHNEWRNDNAEEHDEEHGGRALSLEEK